MNVAFLIGRVGRNPEIREFANGGRVAQFTLATNRYWRDRSTGERREKTDWHRIRVRGGASGGLVDRVSQYVEKGMRLQIQGEITSTTVINDRGERIPVTFIDVRRSDGIELLDLPRRRDTQDEHPSADDADARNAGLGPLASDATTSGDADAALPDIADFDDDMLLPDSALDELGDPDLA
jgi:single stranded DNA-binding protein